MGFINVLASDRAGKVRESMRTSWRRSVHQGRFGCRQAWRPGRYQEPRFERLPLCNSYGSVNSDRQLIS